MRKDRRKEELIIRIAELSRRRDQLMRAPKPDLEALERLADDYEAAGLSGSAADLYSRLEWNRVDLL